MNNGVLDNHAAELRELLFRYRERLDEMHHPGWRDIKTADKTKPAIIGRAGYVPQIATWYDGCWCHYPYEFDQSEKFVAFEPTHWMPLPAIGDPADMLKVRREQNTAVAEMIKQQGRAMAYLAGETIEPQVHFAEAVVRGSTL